MSNWHINVHFRPSSSGKLYLTPKTRSGNEATDSGVSWHASMDSWWPTVACVPEPLHVCVLLNRGLTHARFRGPSATCGRAVSYPCSFVVASYNYARHCARRALGIVQVSPPTPGDLKNTPKHRFLGRSKL